MSTLAQRNDLTIRNLGITGDVQVDGTVTATGGFVGPGSGGGSSEPITTGFVAIADLTVVSETSPLIDFDMALSDGTDIAYDHDEDASLVTILESGVYSVSISGSWAVAIDDSRSRSLAVEVGLPGATPNASYIFMTGQMISQIHLTDPVPTVNHTHQVSGAGYLPAGATIHGRVGNSDPANDADVSLYLTIARIL